MPHANEFDTRQYMLDNAFEAFYYEDANLEQVPSHQHNFYEIYLFEGGDVTYEVRDKLYNLLPGDILLFPPQEPHHPIFNSWRVTYSRLVLWISERFIQNAKESCNCNFALPFDLISEHGVHLMRLDPVVRNELSKIVFDMVSREEETYARAQNNISLLCFLVKLNRIYAKYNMPTDKKDPFAPHLIRIVDYVANNFERPITLEDISGHCFISKYHLAHEFKRTMGMTIYQYVTMRRMYRVKQMLLSGIKPGEAAKQCGFSDYTTFFRAFKKEYGCSPKAFFSSKNGNMADLNLD